MMCKQCNNKGCQTAQKATIGLLSAVVSALKYGCLLLFGVLVLQNQIHA